MSQPQQAEFTPFTGDLVPVIEEQIPEVSTGGELAVALLQFMDSDLLGFIVRQSGIDGVPVEDNLELRETVRQNLDLMGYPFGNGLEMRDFTARSEVGNGIMHVDIRDVFIVSTINVHTTISGAGRVVLANSGPQARNIMYQRRYERMLSRSIIDGETDESIILPNLAVADLNQGDSVIFPLANRRGPVWHRFDTFVSPRSADIAALELDAA